MCCVTCERVVTKQELLDALWAGEVVNEAAVAWSVSHARRAREQGRANKGPIETVYGRGYLFSAEVEPVAAEVEALPPSTAPALRESSVSPRAVPFVGRSAAMQRFQARFDSALEGRGGAAFEMFPELADNKLGSTGHSQGGQAALVTIQLAEAKYGDKMTYAGLAMEPASGFGTQPSGQTWQQAYSKITSPVFMFSGDSATGYANSRLLGMSEGDGLVAISWVQEGYDALSKTVEAYHWTAVGGTHIPTPVEPEQQVSIPWFRWKLLGDKAACEFFKTLPGGGKWKVQKEQNAEPCG